MDMTIHTCVSFVDTVLGIYTLNKGLLGTPLASNDDTDLCPNASDTAASLLTFTFHVGILYMIVVDSKPMESGQIQLSLTQGGKRHRSSPHARLVLFFLLLLYLRFFYLPFLIARPDSSPPS